MGDDAPHSSPDAGSTREATRDAGADDVSTRETSTDADDGPSVDALGEGRVGRVLRWYPAVLARLGLVERRAGTEAFDLAVPAMVTGGMRTLVRASDFFMVSIASGAAGVAALELGFQFYFVAFGLSLAISSGTISSVSRFVGADDYARADLALKQSVTLSILLSVPLLLAAWWYAEPLIDVLSNDPRTIALGGIYLRIVMLAAPSRFLAMVGARAIAATGDTRTPMYVRSLALPTNVFLNAVLIFGLGPVPALGVAGAAWGTAAANTLTAVVLMALLVRGHNGVRLRLGGPQWDWGIARDLVGVGLPLSGMRLARTFGRFPFLFVLGVLGTDVVAAYAIGRRVMLVAMMPAWGYSTAASTLVGQSVGAGDVERATTYGWETLRIALVTQLLIAGAIALFADPLTRAFNPEDVSLTVSFVRAFALGVAGFSVSRTMRGALRGVGDTRWPFYGTVVATYAAQLPVALLSLPVGFVVPLTVLGPLASYLPPFSPGVGWGLAGTFLAIVVAMYVRALVNLARFRSGRWRRGTDA